MKPIIVFNSFKDCMGSYELGTIVLNSLIKKYNDEHHDNKSHSLSNDRVLTISDGGEGFIDSLEHPLQLKRKSIRVVGPLGDTITSEYGYNETTGVAIIEMAKASGIELVPESKRNPFNTTTYGTGQLILDALTSGFKRILIGAGGSATSDGGIGALQAIGMKIVTSGSENTNIEDAVVFGRDLPRITSIDYNDIQKKWKDNVNIAFCTDVTNPFVGPRGAVYTFAGQKGATQEMKVILEEGMNQFTKLLPTDISTAPGTGAAGGLPGGFVSILNAEILKGVDYVCQLNGLQDKLKDCDIIFTGEGSFDNSSMDGKTVSRMIAYGKSLNIPVVIICGRKDLQSLSIGENEYREIEKGVINIVNLGERFGSKLYIIDLVSNFGLEKALHQTKQCIQHIIENMLLKIDLK